MSAEDGIFTITIGQMENIYRDIERLTPVLEGRRYIDIQNGNAKGYLSSILLTLHKVMEPHVSEKVKVAAQEMLRRKKA